MAQDTEYITTRRAGIWSRAMQYHDSPWWASDEEAVADLVPGDGWTVTVKNSITIDTDVTVGLSLQSQIWTPLAVSTTAGSTATSLVSGSYTAAAAVKSSKGQTWIGNTATAAFSIVNGTSKPRVTFSAPPPAGCEYWLFLSSPLNQDLRPVLYCRGITGTTVDLVGGNYDNTWSAGIAAGSSTTFGNSVGMKSTGVTNALRIQSSGTITIAAGKTLTVRGDIGIESSKNSTKAYIIIEPGATLKFDPNQADVPAYDLYRLLITGDGDIRIKG